MARSRRTDLVIVAVALAVAVLAAAAVVVLASNRSVGRAPVSRGEAIFQAGVDANGNPIPRTGGGMMGGGMMVAGCATCHGPDGHGRTTPMFTSPMPQWQLTSGQWSDLLANLKTLK